MITDLVFTILSWLIYTISIILPTFSFIDTTFISAFNYVLRVFAGFNFIFPIDTIFSVIYSIITFEIAYYGAKIVLGIIHFFRGSGEIKI